MRIVCKLHTIFPHNRVICTLLISLLNDVTELIEKIQGNPKSQKLKARVDYKSGFGKDLHKLEVRNEFWSYGEYELVGHGKQTNAECGKFKRFDGCLNVEAHNMARFFQPDLEKNSIFVKSVYHSCDKPTCPKCFKYGWAVRQATRMEKRLNEEEKAMPSTDPDIVKLRSLRREEIEKRRYSIDIEEAAIMDMMVKMVDCEKSG